MIDFNNKKKVCFFVFTIVLGLSLLSSSVLAVVCDVTAQSGSAQHIQDAVDEVAAAGIGNVCIPEGTFNFTDGPPWQKVSAPAGVNIFGAPTERDADDQVIEWKTILVMPYEAPNEIEWFDFTGNGDPTKPSRFSDIQLVGYRAFDPNASYPEYWGVDMNDIIDFRIDHNFFHYITGGLSIDSVDDGDSSGVIDHNRFINEIGIPAGYEQRTVGYGVHVSPGYHTTRWEPIDQVVGQYTSYTVFIEDNYFQGWRHVVSSGWGAHYVFRYNTIQYDFGYGSIDAHGVYEIVGTRAIEVYNNELLDAEGGWVYDGIRIRGGGGVVFNNTIDDSYVIFIELQEEGSPPYTVHDLYIWNNDVATGVIFISNAGGFVENEDYFLYEKSGYVPYPYPHPLTLEGPTTTTSTTTSTTTTITTTTSTTTTIPAGQVTISGQLMNATDTIEANITVYNQDTDQVNASTLTTGGSYSLDVWPDVYDLRYNILEFFISNFFIKLMSINIFSDLPDVLNRVTGYPSENITFTVNITTDQMIQVHSEDKPKNVTANGILLTEGSYPPQSNEWYYNLSEEKLHMKVSPPVTTTTTTSTTTTISETTTTVFTTTTTVPPASIAFLVADTGSLTSKETAIKNRVEGWGWTVTLKDDDATPDSWDSTTYDGVIISQSVTSSSVTWLCSKAVGFLSYELYLVDDFDMGDPNPATPSITQINIVDNTHYITSPYSTGNLTVLTSAKDVGFAENWANDVNDLAQKTDDATLAAILEIDKGETLVGGGAAPERRVLWIPGNMEGSDSFNSDGWNLFDRALKWVCYQ